MTRLREGDPAPGTGVRTKRLCSYRDEGEPLDAIGASVLGISPQPVDSHERFVSEKSLDVPPPADEDRAVAGAYGVLAGPMVRRAILVADEEGIVRRRKVTPAGLSYESAADIEAAVAAIA